MSLHDPALLPFFSLQSQYEQNYVCRSLGLELGPMPFVNVVKLIHNRELGAKDEIRTEHNG